MENCMHLRTFPYIFTPLPKKCTGLGYIDYKQDPDDMPLMLSVLSHKQGIYEWWIYVSDDLPEFPIVFLKLSPELYKETESLIQNLPVKLKVIYGQEISDKYKISGQIIDRMIQNSLDKKN